MSSFVRKPNHSCSPVLIKARKTDEIMEDRSTVDVGACAFHQVFFHWGGSSNICREDAEKNAGRELHLEDSGGVS